MNKLFKTIISIVGISMAFAGCTGDFDNMNTDLTILLRVRSILSSS